MSGSFDDRGAIDPHRGLIIVCVGKKRSGKSVMALLIFQSYPGDRVVIDVAADDGPMGEDVITLRGPVDELPTSLESLRRRDGERMTIRYVPDAGSETFLEDVDHVIGLTYNHSSKDRPACLLVHEAGRVVPSNRTLPQTMRVLQHGRHHHLTSLWCMPRPVTVDPLLIGQADLVYTFDVPQPGDRRRIAENIGWDPISFDEGVHGLVPHGYLRYDANEPKPQDDDDIDQRLMEFDPLPPEVVQQVTRWAQGKPPAPVV